MTGQSRPKDGVLSHAYLPPAGRSMRPGMRAEGTSPDTTAKGTSPAMTV